MCVSVRLEGARFRPCFTFAHKKRKEKRQKSQKSVGLVPFFLLVWCFVPIATSLASPLLCECDTSPGGGRCFLRFCSNAWARGRQAHSRSVPPAVPQTYNHRFVPRPPTYRPLPPPPPPPSQPLPLLGHIRPPSRLFSPATEKRIIFNVTFLCMFACFLPRSRTARAPLPIPGIYVLFCCSPQIQVLM